MPQRFALRHCPAEGLDSTVLVRRMDQRWRRSEHGSDWVREVVGRGWWCCGSIFRSSGFIVWAFVFHEDWLDGMYCILWWMIRVLYVNRTALQWISWQKCELCEHPHQHTWRSLVLDIVRHYPSLRADNARYIIQVPSFIIKWPSYCRRVTGWKIRFIRPGVKSD